MKTLRKITNVGVGSRQDKTNFANQTFRKLSDSQSNVKTLLSEEKAMRQRGHFKH